MVGTTIGNFCICRGIDNYTNYVNGVIDKSYPIIMNGGEYYG